MSDHILMGMREAGVCLGVTDQRVKQLWQEHPEFPTPIDVLWKGRPVWWAEDIEKFAEIPRPVGRPKGWRKVKT